MVEPPTGPPSGDDPQRLARYRLRYVFFNGWPTDRPTALDRRDFDTTLLWNMAALVFVATPGAALALGASDSQAMAAVMASLVLGGIIAWAYQKWVHHDWQLRQGEEGQGQRAD